MSSVGAAPRAAVPTSSARAAASRKNGARSRGPKTVHGKARSSKNALKHGLQAHKYVVLPHEDGAEFAALEAALIEELAPQGALQSILVGRIAVASWRLARADRLEVEVFEVRSYADAGPALEAPPKSSAARQPLARRPPPNEPGPHRPEPRAERRVDYVPPEPAAPTLHEAAAR
jgi:hypothetical protein